MSRPRIFDDVDVIALQKHPNVPTFVKNFMKFQTLISKKSQQQSISTWTLREREFYSLHKQLQSRSPLNLFKSYSFFENMSIFFNFLKSFIQF